MSREERLAARLMAAIGPLLPAWCALSIHAGWLHVAIHGDVEVSMCLIATEGIPERDAALADSILNTIQDAIVRTSTRPWPPASEPTFLPIAEAAVRQGQLLAWFGPEAHPTVALQPIDLAAV
jgi:hypothetical protein